SEGEKRRRKAKAKSEGDEKPSQAFPFAFFAASREENLLSNFAPNWGCIPVAPWRGVRLVRLE
ncbi:MAG: hypothetical protein NTZ50_05315, partial [Chloroflexi bacterium]|nr:hypothetical protein [Chloroflexota bacterium]